MNSSELQQMEGLLRLDTQAEFRIERLLGRGGMAVVYLATEIHLDRKVAIKVLPPELTFGQGVERFKREAKTAAALDHPHIIPIYRVASGNKIFWYAMKYLEGRSLEDLLKERRRLSLDETIAILDQVAKALDHAHKHHVIHRDVKPANIMVDAENRVVVTDFGIAKALTAGGLTASGSVVGTPYYMSPEQGMGGDLSGASDQYSVGVMAYRMLSGRVLFDGDSPIEILHKHCMEPPPSLETVGAGLPPHVYGAVHRALAKKPAQRFRSVGAFVEALRRPAADATLPGLSATRTSIRATGKGRRRVLVAAIGATAGVAVLVAVWLGRHQGGSPSVAAGSAPAAESATMPSSSPAPVPPQPPPTAKADARPAPALGQVTVTGLPAGGRIAVDGAPQARATFSARAGRHEIRMEARGFEPQTAVVTVAAGERITLPFTRRLLAQPVTSPAPLAATPVQPRGAGLNGRGVLTLFINPDADVFIDEVYLGLAHTVSDTLPPGPHLVRLEREGFRTVDTTVSVGTDQVVHVEFRLKKP